MRPAASNRGQVDPFSDTITIFEDVNDREKLFEWQQPLRPWQYWLSRLTKPGQLIVDPYCGLGTTAVAIKSIGGRRIITTEADRERALAAKARVAGTVEGSYLNS